MATTDRRHAPAVVGPAPRDVWREVHAADPDAVATQSPEWGDALATRGYTDASRLYELPDGRRLVLPLAARRRAGVTLSEESWPYGWGYGGAVVEGGALTAADARVVLDDLRRRPAVLRAAVPMPLRGGVWDEAAAPDVARVPYTSQVVDLGAGWDHLWEKGFKRQARNSVRKAERFELDVRREDGTTAAGPDGRGLAVFRELYAQSVDRWAAQRGQPLAVARRLAAHRDRPGQVAAAAAALGEQCVVWSVLRDGVPVAANIVLGSGASGATGGGPGNHAIGWMCAMDTTGIARETLATYLLHSLAIKDACEHGVRWFHMGESDAGSGPEHFKRYFGAVGVSYAALRFERLPLSRGEQAARRALGAVSRLRARGEGRSS